MLLFNPTAVKEVVEGSSRQRKSRVWEAPTHGLNCSLKGLLRLATARLGLILRLAGGVGLHGVLKVLNGGDGVLLVRVRVRGLADELLERVLCLCDDGRVFGRVRDLGRERDAEAVHGVEVVGRAAQNLSVGRNRL